jgi:hypothetical protein
VTRSQLKDLNFLGWLFCAALLVITCHQSEERTQPRDFVYFYSVGQILNRYTPDHLYQEKLQRKTFNDILPLKNGIYGPSPYPPYVALFFRPFALLPFWTAYHLWISISMVLYLAGILLLVKRFFPGDKLLQSFLCCFALLFWTFIARTFLNGQLSVIGFLAIACAICLENADHRYLSGAALAFCAYKPTLLLLLVPMLVVTRRLKILSGFIAAVSLLAGLTTIIEGSGIWLNYIYFSAKFAHLDNFVLCDYVDLAAALHTAWRHSPLLAWLLCGLAVTSMVLLLRIWLAGSQGQRVPATLVWGTTVTWTLVLNVYVPLYDTILVIASLIITATALKKFKSHTFVLICFALLVSSYVTRSIAERTGIQIFTLVLIALGALQMMLCFRIASNRIAPVCNQFDFAIRPDS